MRVVGSFERNSVTPHVVSWQGRSGQNYSLTVENLDSFSMQDADLYVLSKGSHILWVGSTAELVADPTSRTRFRLAMDCASQALRLDRPENRNAAIWDLEGGFPQSLARAQAA